MNISTLNWPAILVAAFVTFLMGYLWYSPLLFGKAWMKEIGFKKDDSKRPDMTKVLSLFFVFSFIMAFNLAMFLNDPKTNIQMGAFYGFLAGFGWVAMSIFITGQFERKSTRYMLIHGGYYIVCFILMGAILGGWR
jgi:hypothetical protein